MFSSLRFRLWLSYALVIVAALSAVAVALLIYLLRNPFLYRQTIERLKAVETILLSREDQLREMSLQAALEKAARAFDVRILLYSQEREVLVDTQAGSAPELSFPQKNLFNRATPWTRDGQGRLWLYTLRQLPDGTWLLIAAQRPRLSILGVFSEELPLMFLGGGLIALLFSLALAFLIARWIADPLQKVVGTARAIPSVEARPVEERGPREVRELTRAFNSMVARLQSSQRSQRDFVANVSHELKTPLTSIQGFAQAILDGTAESPEARRQAAEVIYNESGRMHRLVLDLLDLARLDAGTADLKMTPLDMTAILNAAAEKFSLNAQKAGVSLKVETPAHLPVLVGDGDRLAQVFTNLIDNALKHTPPGGIIALRASATRDEMQVSVSDTGSGIPTDALPHIFERFYQADPARRGGEKHGAGLGLAIGREIVETHGGRISVRSGEAGTTFDVFLPLSQTTAITAARRK
jgi:signal transduction histidine kinase